MSVKAYRSNQNIYNCKILARTMYENILSEKDYMAVAQNYFQDKNAKVVNHQLKPIADIVKGFAGDHLRVELTCELNGEKKDVVLFLKTKPLKNDSQKNLVENLNLYTKEIFFYDVLKPEFDKINCNTSFAPKCYYVVPGVTLVMENITLRGFQLAPVFSFYDLDHCRAGLRSLAMMHAAGYVLEETKSKELERVFRLGSEYLELSSEEFFRKGGMGMRWVESSRKIFVNLIDCLPESDTYKEEFRKKLREKTFGAPFHTQYNIRKTIGHGDLWSNNMMFKYENQQATACCLLDYQLMRYHFPSYDPLLYLYSNTSREFRQAHTNGLLDFYYEILSEEVEKHGYNIDVIHSRKDFDESVKFSRFEPMLQGFGCQSAWCFTEKYFSELMRSGNGIEEFWFGDRTPEVLKQMTMNDDYKKMMTDCLYDFHDLLFND